MLPLEGMKGDLSSKAKKILKDLLGISNQPMKDMEHRFIAFA
jgi:hypothetical protein